MIDCGSLELAQARIQARHGQRPGPAGWQGLTAARELGTLLDAARSTALQPWLQGITAGSSAPGIEAVLRRHWRGAVAEVAGWMPAAWRPALHWCAVLPELPLLQHLARGGDVQPWMADDPDYGALCAAPAPARGGVLARSSRYAPLANAWRTPDALGRAWHAEWQRCLPHRAGTDDSLRQFAAAITAHTAAFDAAAPGPGALLREALRARLALLLRRATLEPALAFIHLALCALDLERLRGELLDRALFAPPREA